MASASSADRYRLPVQPPIRNLLIASMSGLAGSIEVIAWAAFRLPGFVLAAGVLLITVGVGFAVAALTRHWALRWVLYVGFDGLTVVNRTRRRQVPWSDIGSVRLISSQLVILTPDGRRRLTLPIDRTRSAQHAATGIVQEINARLSTPS